MKAFQPAIIRPAYYLENTHFLCNKWNLKGKKEKSYCHRVLHISYSRGKFTEVKLRAIHERMDQVSTVPASFNTSLFPLFIIGKDSSMILSCSNSLVRQNTKSGRIHINYESCRIILYYSPSALTAAFQWRKPPTKKVSKWLHKKCYKCTQRHCSYCSVFYIFENPFQKNHCPSI